MGQSQGTPAGDEALGFPAASAGQDFQKDLPFLEPGLEDGPGETFQFPLEGTAGAPGAEIQPKVEARQFLILEGADPGGTSLGGALPVNPPQRITLSKGSGSFWGRGSRFGNGPHRFAPETAGLGGRPGVGQHEDLLGEGKAEGLFQESEGEGGAQLQAHEPAGASALGAGVENHQGIPSTFATGVETGLDAAFFHFQAHFQGSDPAGRAILEAEANSAPHPRKDIAFLNAVDADVLKGAAAHPAGDEEERDHQRKHQVEQVVAGIHGKHTHQQHGGQVFQAEAGDGELKAAVVPEFHGEKS